MRKKTSVSLLRLFQHGKSGTRSGKRLLVRQRVTAFEVAETPVALFRLVLGTADAAQALAALHAIEQDFKHGAGGLTQRNDKDAFELREIDDVGSAAVWDKPLAGCCLRSESGDRRRTRCCMLRARRKKTRWHGREENREQYRWPASLHLLLQPSRERTLHLLEATGKEVVRAGDEHQAFGVGGGINHLLQFMFGCKRIVIAAEK